jgi:hypothetical protein
MISSIVAPASRFSKTADTGIRVFRSICPLALQGECGGFIRILDVLPGQQRCREADHRGCGWTNHGQRDLRENHSLQAGLEQVKWGLSAREDSADTGTS